MSGPGAGALAGKRVVVTQALHQAGELARLLHEHGAEPLLYPCIAIAPTEDTSALDRAIRDAAAGGYDWLVLTSANTVAALAGRLRALGLPWDSLASVATAAVGPATAEAAREQLGVRVDLVPAEHVAEGLAAYLAAQLHPGQRLFVPQADIARPVLMQQLGEAGAEVTSPPAYRTVMGSGGVDLPALLAARQVDAVLLTSSSTARNLLRRLHDEGGDESLLAGVCIACIGPVTAATALELGLSVAATAQEQTLEGLVAALCAAC